MRHPMGPTLRTARLRLRRWRPEDLDPFAELNADPVVMEHFPALLDRAGTERLVERIEAHFDEHGFGLWAVEVVEAVESGVEPGVEPGVDARAGGARRAGAAEDADAPPFVGFVGLAVAPFDAPFTPAVEVGWRLCRSSWGRGYATEGARAALAFGFEEVGLTEVVSFTVPANLRSRAVMERLGMTHDPSDDFDHPNLPDGHPLRRHVLYRLARPTDGAGPARGARQADR